MVSIHALLAECDWIALPLEDYQKGFNPRTPCGVRQQLRQDLQHKIWFQSTHSLRSATLALLIIHHDERFQSTHSLRSATRLIELRLRVFRVSIHALLAECDGVTPLPASEKVWFQSTHSLRSATVKPEDLEGKLKSFNPRTPCGVRPDISVLLPSIPCFNPRTPCGVRRSTPRMLDPLPKFQSTHSLRSATA